MRVLTRIQIRLIKIRPEIVICRVQKLSLPFLLILLACPSFAASSSRLVPADDPRFHYEGRIDRSQPAAPAIIWQASRVEIDFYGDSLVFQFSELDGDVYFDLV